MQINYLRHMQIKKIIILLKERVFSTVYVCYYLLLKSLNFFVILRLMQDVILDLFSLSRPKK